MSKRKTNGYVTLPVLAGALQMGAQELRRRAQNGQLTFVQRKGKTGHYRVPVDTLRQLVLGTNGNGNGHKATAPQPLTDDELLRSAGLMTVAEASERLGLKSPISLYGQIRRKRIAVERIAGQMFITEEALQKYDKSRRINARGLLKHHLQLRTEYEKLQAQLRR